MDERMQKAELVILALMIFLLVGFFFYIANNIEEYKNSQNPEQYCKEIGFVDINIHNYPYQKDENK